jgi:hypothetical protein
VKKGRSENTQVLTFSIAFNLFVELLLSES